MTQGEKGFLLLTSQLGNPERHPLTTAQMRVLAQRMRYMARSDSNRELTALDLRHLGYGEEMAERIVSLLAEEDLLEYYLQKGEIAGCVPLTRATPQYPLTVRKRLGTDSPGCLWAKGDLSLLDTPMISLVGSRSLRTENHRFAESVGKQVALQGYTLVSGNAKGADRTAQEACLAAGGNVISVVADELTVKRIGKGVLYLSEEGYDQPFTAQRALSRNRVIHSMGMLTMVAQCSMKIGGTWDGTCKNLEHGWTPVCCFDDGTDVTDVLEQMGARKIGFEQLFNLMELIWREPTIFDMTE